VASTAVRCWAGAGHRRLVVNCACHFARAHQAMRAVYCAALRSHALQFRHLTRFLFRLTTESLISVIVAIPTPQSGFLFPLTWLAVCAPVLNRSLQTNLLRHSNDVHAKRFISPLTSAFTKRRRLPAPVTKLCRYSIQPWWSKALRRFWAIFDGSGCGGPRQLVWKSGSASVGCGDLGVLHCMR